MQQISKFQNIEPYISKFHQNKLKQYKEYDDNFHDPREHPLLQSDKKPYYQKMLNTFGKLHELQNLD